MPFYVVVEESTVLSERQNCVQSGCAPDATTDLFKQSYVVL